MEINRNINISCESLTTIGGCSGNAAASPGTIGRIHGMLRGMDSECAFPGVWASKVNVGCAAVEDS
jgi:hypothetical protein